MDYEQITKLVGIITALREPYDHHGSRVARWVVSMARALSLPDDEVRLMEVGAHLHDIGKLILRKDIINAERRLSENERKEMQTHTVLGWEAVMEAGYDPMILDIVRHHHERLDGSGYPDGLKEGEISRPIQVVSICDVYEALTHKRPYREAYSHQFAMAMIQKDKRKTFDSELVDLFFAKVARG